MKLPHSFRQAALVLTVGITSFATAQTQPAERRGPPAERPNLERSMKAMNRALKAIAGQVNDPSKDADTLVLIDALQRATIDAKGVVPDEVRDQTGEAKTRETLAYRARMINLLKAQITLEEAVARGDRAAAKEAIDALQDQRRDGHEEYGVKDHDQPKK